MGRYPGCEVHSGSSVQQQGGDIHVTIVSRDVQRGKPTLFDKDKERGGKERVRGKGNEVGGHTEEETEDRLKQQVRKKENSFKRRAR